MGDELHAGKSRRDVLAFALLIALTAQANAQVVLDDHTPCSAAVEAFASHDKEKMREVVAYIDSVFGQLDQAQRTSGEVGSLAQQNDQEGSILISVAVGFCRQTQKGTIRNQAGRAY